MTNALSVSTTALLAQALTATYLVCCSNLLTDPLSLVSSLQHLLLLTTAKVILMNHRTGFAIYQFKNSLTTFSALWFFIPIHYPKCTIGHFPNIFTVFLSLSYLQPLAFCLAISAFFPWILAHSSFSNSPCYPERLSLNAAFSSMKLLSGFYWQ